MRNKDKNIFIAIHILPMKMQLKDVRILWPGWGICFAGFHFSCSTKVLREGFSLSRWSLGVLGLAELWGQAIVGWETCLQTSKWAHICSSTGRTLGQKFRLLNPLSAYPSLTLLCDVKALEAETPCEGQQRGKSLSGTISLDFVSAENIESNFWDVSYKRS